MPYYTLWFGSIKGTGRIANVKLYPGMPAMVIVPTVERTAFELPHGTAGAVLQYGFPAEMKRRPLDCMH